MDLQPWDPLPRPPDRVLVAGASGAGKSTLARRVAAAMGVPYQEIDALFHGPGWQPRQTFVEDVAAFIDQPRWVTEWQYQAVLAMLSERADLLLWLDLPRAVVLRRVLRRTVRRRLRRERLWNGNMEPGLHRMLLDREHVVRWSWQTFEASRRRVLALASSRPELPVVRLSRPGDAGAWLDGPLRDAVRSRNGCPGRNTDHGGGP